MDMSKRSDEAPMTFILVSCNDVLMPNFGQCCEYFMSILTVVKTESFSFLFEIQICMVIVQWSCLKLAIPVIINNK